MSTDIERVREVAPTFEPVASACDVEKKNLRRHGWNEKTNGILQIAPFSGANIGVYWLRVHALGAERDMK